MTIGASMPDGPDPGDEGGGKPAAVGDGRAQPVPAGARPHSRVILVLGQVSSVKIRRSGSRPGRASIRAARAAAISGRACPLAWPDLS